MTQLHLREMLDQLRDMKRQLFEMESFIERQIQFTPDDVNLALSKGEKIQAIKIYQRLNGCSLVEAKHHVENLESVFS